MGDLAQGDAHYTRKDVYSASPLFVVIRPRVFVLSCLPKTEIANMGGGILLPRYRVRFSIGSVHGDL